ncbi:hypothetical protein HPHPP16_0927 [Helicobacter pylori Hp P-16]|nr:hypothetical protein HPHPP16_0927 [Helicobacter pylori Hp P-16]
MFAFLILPCSLLYTLSFTPFFPLLKPRSLKKSYRLLEFQAVPA